MISACAHKSFGDPGAPVAGTVLGAAIHTGDAEELRYYVLKELTDRYARDKDITVTPAEKAAYVEHMQEAMRADRAQRAARRDELTRRLAGGGLAEAERKALTSELGTIGSLAELEGKESAGADPEDARARETIAGAFILQWKINRELYRQYGGRILFQQGGPEPLDAYRRFLEEQQARGDFRILNKDLKTAFWRYYLTDSIHSFYAPGSSEEAQAFATPWWSAKQAPR
jgi:hypothetical protein